jgi:2-polyprenyl-3-methyl-5-hydroxy-6-metoxy-1,4-benzoquinol methylase
MKPPPDTKEEEKELVCPACGGGIGSEAIDGYKGYKLYHCYACDLMFWYPMKSVASEWYEDFYGAPIDLTPHKPAQILWSQNQLLKDRPAPGGRLLDIGCGLGDFLFMAQKAGYLVTGIDFSPKFIEIARQRFGFDEVYPWTLEDFVAEKPDSKYDVITFFEVLEHLDNVRDFSQLVKTLLKPGGYVACSVPDRDRWRFLSRWLLSHVSQERDYPPHHLTRWNPAALTNFFNSYGFTILAIKREPPVSRSLRSLGYGGWLLSSELGIQRLGVVLAKKVETEDTNRASTPQRSILGMIKGMVIRLAGKLYYEVLAPLLGLALLPLWLLLRRQGASIYLIARLKEAK